MPDGIILKGIGSFYYVRTQEGIFECKARGIFRKDNFIPLPGDRVKISVTDGEKKQGWIESIDKRNSQLVRPAVANISTVIIVIAVKNPAPDMLLMDKLLIAAEKENLKAVLCVNKIDMGDDSLVENIKKAYAPSGYRVIATSSILGAGFEELGECLRDGISVLAGQSGVGKSTILNRLRGSNVMETGELSRKIERGKHTTRHAELFEIEEGSFIVDTPGFSSYDISDIDKDELQNYYPDFKKFLGKCRFRGCGHVSEPDCSVKDAVKAGEMDEGRYSRYVTLYRNMDIKRW